MGASHPLAVSVISNYILELWGGSYSKSYFNSFAFSSEFKVGGVLNDNYMLVYGLKTLPASKQLGGKPSIPIYDKVGLQVLFKYASKLDSTYDLVFL